MKYRKKPVVIEAILWTGQNIETMKGFIGASATYNEHLAKLYINTLGGGL